MENTTISELKKQRNFYLEKISELNRQIAEHQTQILKEKYKAAKKELKAVNRDYINVFSGNPYLTQKLFSKIDEISFFFSHGLITRLKNNGIFYIWQIVIHTEEYYRQPKVLGTIMTTKLKRDLAENGLYFGMKLC